MTREQFTAEFRRGMRFVIQKHDRVCEVSTRLREHGSTPARERAYAEAQTNLDAAIDQVADHVFDALEQLASLAVGAR